jgi:hypothetical protein
LREERTARVVNGHEYEGRITGIQAEQRSGDRGRADRRFEIKDAVYRQTGERFRYERVYDRVNDVYMKKYTNLETGEVQVESTERLSEHRGRGAARRPGDTRRSPDETELGE